MGDQEDKFKAKVTELAALCRNLDIFKILALRRMTLVDPEALKWASSQQLEAVFTVILTDRIADSSFENLEYADNHQFEEWIPPGPDDVRDRERWMLHDMAKPHLHKNASIMSYSTPAAAPSVDVDSLLADEDDDGAEKPFTTFNELFDNTIIRYLRRTLRVLQVNSIRSHTPPPFYAAPQFSACFLPVVKKLIVPTMRASRLVKELSTSRDWSKNGEARLIGIIQDGEARQNPILHQWDARWDHFSLQSQNAMRAKGNKADKIEDTPWPALIADGGKHEYLGADEPHLWIIKSLLRWEPETLAETWKGLTQLYAQEFAPASKHDQAREGAFRDGLAKAINKLPMMAGEALTVKAFFECPKCDKQFLHKLTQTFGMSRQRQAAVPLLMHFIENLPK